MLILNASEAMQITVVERLMRYDKRRLTHVCHADQYSSVTASSMVKAAADLRRAQLSQSLDQQSGRE